MNRNNSQRIKIVINGIGCTVSGAKLVLTSFLDSCPKNIEIHAFAPKKVMLPNTNEGIRLLTFNHTLWGKWLRIPYEVYLNAYSRIIQADLILNLSNYGLCLTNNQILYIHNPFLLDPESQSLQYSVKRFFLSTYLRSTKLLVVQTDHMYSGLLRYCKSQAFPLRKTLVLKPLPDIKAIPNIVSVKKYPFEFFYPASNFPHKRTNLAIDGIKELSNKIPQIGLTITTNHKVNDSSCINEIGFVDHDIAMYHLYQADALLFTSERETLGLPLLESLFFEKPAVLPDLAYAREIYGDSAVYFKEPNEKQVAEAILKLFNNYSKLKRKVIERRKNEWQNRQTWRDQWVTILNQVDG